MALNSLYLGGYGTTYTRLIQDLLYVAVGIEGLQLMTAECTALKAELVPREHVIYSLNSLKGII